LKPVHPKRFYITDWALADDRCRARMQRLMQGFGVPVERVQVLTEDDLADVVRANDWGDLDVRQGAVRFGGDPDVVFNKFRWATEEEVTATVQRHPLLREATGYTATFLRMLYGHMDFYHLESGPHKRDKRDIMCWELYDLHSACGCFHKCQYCRRGRVTNLMLNVEEFVEQVDGLMQRNPWQTVFRYDVETDPLVLEPEYGACRALVEHYAGLDDRYIILFSKSDNVDFLLDLDHRGHTIMLWTLNSPTVTRRIEIDTATTAERIEAARKCQAAGYTVRFKFKPIVPLANWRQEATDMLEQLFAAVEPDNLSMELLFFDTVAEWKSLFDISLFAPKLVERMEQYEKDVGKLDGLHTFPHDVRAEIYAYYADEVKRLSPHTRLSLCAETREMWDALGPKLGMTADSFACNCGPVAVPGVEAKQIRTTADGKAVLDP
jgi:DNA repair photolyase